MQAGLEAANVKPEKLWGWDYSPSQIRSPLNPGLWVRKAIPSYGPDLRHDLVQVSTSQGIRFPICELGLNNCYQPLPSALKLIHCEETGLWNYKHLLHEEVCQWEHMHRSSANYCNFTVSEMDMHNCRRFHPHTCNLSIHCLLTHIV